MSGELSSFEQKSAAIPKQMPYGILGGTILAVIIFFLVSTFAANDAVDSLKDAKKENAAQANAAASSASGEVDDI